jgi:hypothetical protein
MDMNGMTLEGFFLADYERMRQRIKELEAEIERLTPDGYGCHDLHETCDAVKVMVASSYNLRNIATNGIGIDGLREAREMTDDDLQVWASQLYRYTPYGGVKRPIEVDYHNYQYTLEIKETRGRHVYVTDGESESNLVEIDELESQMVDNLDKWCREEHLDELKKAALSYLRNNLESAIAEMEKGND